MENKNEWRKIKLGEVAEYISEKINSSILERKNYISTENMLPNNNGITLASSIPINTKVNKFQEEDILISNIRTYLKKIWKATFNGGSSNDVLIIRKTKNNILSKYIYYTLTQDSFFNYATATSKGTKMPRGDKDSIMNYEFLLPSLQFQKKIVKILSDIDNKIELNNKINNNLEEQAELIFNNYFLENSSSNILKEDKLFILSKEIICGKTPSTKNKEFYGTNIPFITIPDMHNKIYIDSTERLLSFMGADSQKNKYLPINTICVSCIGTAGLVSLTSKISQTNQQINSIIPKTKELTYYIYFLMRNLKDKINLIGASGSTFCNLNKKDFSNILVPIPKDDILKQFYYICLPIFENIKNNQIENEKLNNLKNYLLPKLMNGEIDVEKIEL